MNSNKVKKWAKIIGIFYAVMTVFSVAVLVVLQTLGMLESDVASLKSSGLPAEFKNSRAYKIDWEPQLKSIFTNDHDQSSKTEYATDNESRATFCMPDERKVVTNINGKRNTWDAEVEPDGLTFRYDIGGGKTYGEKEDSRTITIEGDKATFVWVFRVNNLGECKVVSTQLGRVTLIAPEIPRR